VSVRTPDARFNWRGPGEGGHQQAEGRLAAAIAALENLRLELLRLRAGVGQPDDLTASIEEARGVGEAVNLELEAVRETEALS
jgi:hypothetical protein